jgi:hypothetical protein
LTRPAGVSRKLKTCSAHFIEGDAVPANKAAFRFYRCCPAKFLAVLNSNLFEEKNMKASALTLVLAVLFCVTASAQTVYSFKSVVFPGDTFTQTLGINNQSEIAGYHGATVNKGFTLVLPNHFTNENFPNSGQTQVIGINNAGSTDGFYIDNAGTTHGLLHRKGRFTTVDFPGTTFNQLLGLNDKGEAAGYYADADNNDHAYTFQAGMFTPVTTPGVSSQATGVNDEGDVSGFYVDNSGTNHGFLMRGGILTTLDFPQATFTQALGLNNLHQVVGFYMDAAGNTHGFLYDVFSGAFESVNDPKGVDATTINGINDVGQITGFYVDATSGNTNGFVGQIVRCIE